MENLKLYNRFMANCISNANAEGNEENVEEGVDMPVSDLIGAICGLIAEKYSIEEGDNEAMEAKLQEVSMKELMEMISSEMGVAI